MVKLRDRKNLKLTSTMSEFIQLKEKMKLTKTIRAKEREIQFLSSKFKVGDQVEVTCHPDDKPEYGESWFIATIKKIKESMYLVHYKGLGLFGEDDHKKPLMEVVGLNRLRPLQENAGIVESGCFDVDDEVDVLINHGWWRGVVIEVISVEDEADFYHVCIGSFGVELYVEEGLELRRHLDWIHGKWVCSSSNSQELVELPGGLNVESQAKSISQRKENVLPAANLIENTLKRKRGRPEGSRNKTSEKAIEKETEVFNNEHSVVPVDIAQDLIPSAIHSLCIEMANLCIQENNKDKHLLQVAELTTSTVSVKSLNYCQSSSEVENTSSNKEMNENRTRQSPADVTTTAYLYPVEQEKEHPPLLQTDIAQKGGERIETRMEKVHTKVSDNQLVPTPEFALAERPPTSHKNALAAAKQIPNTMEREPSWPKGFQKKTSFKGTVHKSCHNVIIRTRSLASILQKCSTHSLCGEKTKFSLSEDNKDNQLGSECALSEERPTPSHTNSSSQDLDEDSALLLQTESLPFKVTSPLWKSIELMEVLRLMGKQPHFQPLQNENDLFRESYAIGHMYSFSNIIKRLRNAQIEDSRSMFESCLEALSELEKHGFVVKPIQVWIEKVIGKREEYTRLYEKWKTIEKRASEEKREMEAIREHVNESKKNIEKQRIRAEFDRKAAAAPW